MNGYATPTVTGGRPMSEIQAEGMDQTRGVANERQHFIEAGARTLGCTQVSWEAEGVAGHRWVRRFGEQADGLPFNLVAQARQALVVEASALEALLAKRKAARDYATTYRLSDRVRADHIEKETAELAKAHDDAWRATLRVLFDLGRVAERASAIRARRNARPILARQAEQQYQETLTKLAAEAADDDLLAAQLGLTE